MAEAPAVCAPYEIPIELAFTTEIPDAVVHTASPAEIEVMARAGRTEDPEHHPSGVTAVETRLALDSRSFAVHSRPRANGAGGGECIYLDKVTASFGWRSHDIYVADTLKPETCFYNAVLRHEREHAAINDEVLRAFAPRIKAVLEQALAREEPAFEETRGTAVKDVIDRLDASTAAVMAEFAREKAKRNAVIDTAERRLEQTRACVSSAPLRKPRRLGTSGLDPIRR